jgi:hypothetical protein
VFRRRSERPIRHPALPAFEVVVERVEAGKRELVAAVPSPRGVPDRPLAEALIGFEEGLRQAEILMDAWHAPDLEDAWRSCRDALGEARRRAERLRLEAPAVDYEGLVAVLGELMAPLEAFADVDDRITGRS